MRETDLIQHVVDASGARTLIVFGPGDRTLLVDGWTELPIDAIEKFRDSASSWLDRDDPRLLQLLRCEDRTCGRFYLAVPHGTDTAVLFGFETGESVPSSATLEAIAHLATAPQFEPATGTTLSRDDIVDIVAGAAHAVATPLNVISGHAESLMRLAPADDPGRRPLAAMVEHVHRVAETVRRTVAIIRSDHGTESIAIAWPEIVAETLAVSSTMLRRVGARARWSGASEAQPVILADVPAVMGRLFVELRSLAERVGPKGTLALGPSPGNDHAIEIDARTADGTPVAVVAFRNSDRHSAP